MNNRVVLGVSLACLLASAQAWTGTGQTHIEASRNKEISIVGETQDIQARPESWEETSEGTRYCKSTVVTQEAKQDFTDLPVFGKTDQLWAGNLVRGKDVEQGKLTPITIKRASGTLRISGVTFKDKTAKTSINVSAMSNSEVDSAVRKLTNQPVDALEANQALLVTSVYSPEQVAFELGTDVRFLGDLADVFDQDQQTQKNRVLVRFAQTNYRISFDDPEDPYSVFAKGEAISDPEGQIGRDNPPLYIKSVNYGISLYFLATSDEPAPALKAALADIFGDQKDLEKHRALLAKTSLAYFVSGGNSAAAVKPIQAASPDLMLEAATKVIADEKKKFETGRLSGLPLSYSLNYLTSRKPVGITLAAAYDKRECTVIPKGYYSFGLTETCEAGAISVSVADAEGSEKPMDLKNAGSSLNNLDAFASTKDENNVLKVLDTKVVNACAFKFSRTFKNVKTGKDETVYLQADGRLGTDEYEFKINPSKVVEKKANFQIMFNRNTGDARFIKR